VRLPILSTTTRPGLRSRALLEQPFSSCTVHTPPSTRPTAGFLTANVKRDGKTIFKTIVGRPAGSLLAYTGGELFLLRTS